MGLADEALFKNDIRVLGVAYFQGGMSPGPARNELQQDDLQVYAVRLTDFRVWDAFATNLPGTSANDDLGLIGGTFATDSPSIQTYDVKAAGALTFYARANIPLPIEYVSGQSVILRVHAGMLTTVADNTATLDLQVYESDREAGISADLCATAAQSINNLVLADLDFTITAAALGPGDMLDMRIAVAINDAATGTAVIGLIGAVELLVDVKG